MSVYRIALGHDNAAGLADLDPQPRCKGLSAGRRVVAGSGLLIQDGALSANLEYGFLTPNQYDALLTQCGVSSTASALVTVRLPASNNERDFANYNGTIIRPDFPGGASFERRRFLTVTFELIGLEAL